MSNWEYESDKPQATGVVVDFVHEFLAADTNREIVEPADYLWNLSFWKEIPVFHPKGLYRIQHFVNSFRIRMEAINSRYKNGVTCNRSESAGVKLTGSVIVASDPNSFNDEVLLAIETYEYAKSIRTRKSEKP